jgi:polyhydroxybutyrate depolymerase
MPMKAPLVSVLLLAALGVTAGAEDLDLKLSLAGRERTYVVHVPPGAAAKRDLPLVVVLHGGGGSGAGVAKQTGFTAEADRRGFVVAYPDGTRRAGSPLDALGRLGFYTWNAGDCCGPAMEQDVDDVGFIRAMVAAIVAARPINQKRIYAAGISNGGMMAYRLACEASDVFAGVGVVAGAVVVTPCKPVTAVSVIHIHGAEDENVPVAGGIGRKALTRAVYPPVKSSIQLWAAADGCGPAQPTRPSAEVTESRYSDCQGGTMVVYDLVAGGGHSWPGGERMARFLDPPSPAMAATPAIWRFFAAHPKP